MTEQKYKQLLKDLDKFMLVDWSKYSTSEEDDILIDKAYKAWDKIKKLLKQHVEPQIK